MPYEDSEKQLNYMRRWRKAHRVHINNYRTENRQQQNEYQRKYNGEHREQHCEYQQLWRSENPKIQRVYSNISQHPQLYSLDDKCVFCGKIEKLERGHLDYEDEGYNYVTVCHQCNHWMENPIIEAS